LPKRLKQIALPNTHPILEIKPLNVLVGTCHSYRLHVCGNHEVTMLCCENGQRAGACSNVPGAAAIDLVFVGEEQPRALPVRGIEDAWQES
jgi:hypothetical protein